MPSRQRERVRVWVVVATTLSITAAVLAAPSYAAGVISVSKTSLTSGSLRVEGTGAAAAATVMVSVPESTTNGRADAARRQPPPRRLRLRLCPLSG